MPVIIEKRVLYDQALTSPFLIKRSIAFIHFSEPCAHMYKVLIFRLFIASYFGLSHNQTVCAAAGAAVFCCKIFTQ